MTVNKLPSFTLHPYYNKKISGLGVVGLTVCLLFTGCNKSDQVAATEQNLSEQQDTQTSPTEADTPNQPVTSNNDAVADNGVPQGKPVTYDIQNWESNKDNRIELEDISKLQDIFGKIVQTDEDSLDYASNMAVKYRFRKADEPYLDIVDSKSYLEFGWYYANPNDSDEEKKKSVNNAKKVYKAATALMGEEGGNLVSNMLSGQSINSTEVGGQEVEMAKCEFYSCTLTLKK